MPKQYRVPGQGFLNETFSGQYRVPGQGFVNETETDGSVGTATGTSTASAAGVTAAVGTGSASGTSSASAAIPSSQSAATATGTSNAAATGAATNGSAATASGTSTAVAEPLIATTHSDVTSYRLPGHGTVNETTTRQYRVPGGAFLNETQVTGYSGTALGSSAATAVGVALRSSTALSTGTSSAAGVGSALASGSGTAGGTSAAAADGSAIISRPVVCVTPGDYFSYICLDRRADKGLGSGTAAGTSSATGAGGAAIATSGTAAGTSTATGETSGTISSSSGTASGTSTATGVGTAETPYELQIIGTPKVIYSDIRPTGYVGNAFRITRESDGSPFEVGFKVNGKADYEAADAFAPLGWRRHTQYDLTGNGLHLTVPGTVQAPKDFGNTIDGHRTLTFNGPGTTQAMANLSVTWTDIRNTTFMLVMKTGSQGVLEVGNPTRKMSVIGQNDSGMNWTGFQAQALVTSPQVMLIVNNGAANRVLRQNDRVTTAPALASSPATGLTLGNAIVYASPGSLDVLCLVGYDYTLPAGDQTLLMDAGYAVAPGIPRTCNDTVVLHSDSIGAGNSRGANVSAETLWFSRLMAATARPFRWHNQGHGGYTVTQLLAVADAVADACYNPLGENIALLAGGSNDLAAGATAVDTYAKIVQWSGKYKTKGYSKTAVFDQIPRKAIFSNGTTAASYETQRQILIGLIAAGAGTDFDVVASPGTHPILGDPANCNSTNFVDLVHPNPTGNGYYFDRVNADLAAILA